MPLQGRFPSFALAGPLGAAHAHGATAHEVDGHAANSSTVAPCAWFAERTHVAAHPLVCTAIGMPMGAAQAHGVTASEVVHHKTTSFAVAPCAWSGTYGSTWGEENGAEGGGRGFRQMGRRSSKPAHLLGKSHGMDHRASWNIADAWQTRTLLKHVWAELSSCRASSWPHMPEQLGCQSRTQT